MTPPSYSFFSNHFKQVLEHSGAGGHAANLPSNVELASLAT
jgi:hypothetical protein